jgi:mRNA interferase RelE/StbE
MSEFWIRRRTIWLNYPVLGFYKLRYGDYRIIYEILHEEKTVIIHLIRHRKEIYKDLS